jgi:hypothetical protein
MERSFLDELMHAGRPGAVKTTIVVLAALSAVCEMFGIFTVRRTYLRAAALGDSLRCLLLRTGAFERDELSQRLMGAARVADVLEAPATVRSLHEARSFNRQFLRNLTGPLKRDHLSTLGLWAFWLGAILGFATVVVAVYG